MKSCQQNGGASFSENRVDLLMIRQDKGAPKQEQYDADFMMLGKTSYLQEIKDRAITELCSALTLSELEGSSSCSLNSEKDSSISKERKNEIVSSGLTHRSDETTFTANESNEIDCLLERRDMRSKNKPPVKSGNSRIICRENHLGEIERCQIMEENVTSCIEDIQNADDAYADTLQTSTSNELADGFISPVPFDPAKKSHGWSKVKKIFPSLRFIKGLKRQKQFDTKMPRSLPMDDDPQVETVNLRHQHLKDKKNDENWILDHALKEVVAKLEPARRRKVERLVNAFEAVHPLAEKDSLQIEGSEAVMPSEDPESDESRRIESSRRLCTKRNLDWTFAATNIILEALSAIFDQLSSPNKPKYGLIGLLMSVIAVSLCIGEFVYRAREAGVVLRRRGFIWWFSSPFHDYKPFGTFSDVFGLICAGFQCIFSGIQYAYFSHHADNPLKISVLPLIFALCVAFSRFHSRDREPLPHRHYP